MMNAAVTLKDVAAAAGVSISTVSRVLDERLPPSRSAAAQRVRESATALGYQRDIGASALRRGGTQTIGVLVPRLSDTVMALVFEAIFAEAGKLGHFALVSVCGDEPDDEKAAAQSLLARRVDGLVLATSRLDDQLPRHLREREIPHVLVLRTDGVSPSSLGDDELGGYLATRHLIDLGHTDIGLLAGPPFASSARDRQAGYRRAMTEAGLPMPDKHIQRSEYTIEAGESAGKALLEAAPDVTAVFAVNDNLAIGAMASAREHGRLIGDDLALVGYNDIPIASRLPTPLTSVRTPFTQIAATALELLLSPKATSDPIRRAMPTLIPRDSTRRHPGTKG
jgi:LacI family transcriptional regulator